MMANRRVNPKVNGNMYLNYKELSICPVIGCRWGAKQSAKSGFFFEGGARQDGDTLICIYNFARKFFWFFRVKIYGSQTQNQSGRKRRNENYETHGTASNYWALPGMYGIQCRRSPAVHIKALSVIPLSDSRHSEEYGLTPVYVAIWAPRTDFLIEVIQSA